MRDVKFLRIRKGPKEEHRRLEARLLKNYGELCLILLGLDEASTEEIKSIEFRCFIKALLSAEREIERVESSSNIYSEGISKKHMTFDLCEKSPKLTRKNIPDMEPCVIHENWEAMLGTKQQ